MHIKLIICEAKERKKIWDFKRFMAGINKAVNGNCIRINYLLWLYSKNWRKKNQILLFFFPLFIIMRLFFCLLWMNQTIRMCVQVIIQSSCKIFMSKYTSIWLTESKNVKKGKMHGPPKTFNCKSGEKKMHTIVMKIVTRHLKGSNHNL